METKLGVAAVGPEQPDHFGDQSEDEVADGSSTADADDGQVETPEKSEGFPDDGQAILERLDSRLEESQRLLLRQSDLVDRLHTENQALRAGELRNAQLPLVRDLLRLHDDIGRMHDVAGESADDLRLVRESLIDTLARNGIESFAPEHRESFDPRLHSASGVAPTEDESLDKAVAEVTRHGFRWDSGDVIRVAEVRAYRYRGAG